MDKDKMNKAHDLDIAITDYKSRIRAIDKSLEEGSDTKTWNIKITTYFDNTYAQCDFSQDNRIDYTTLKLIKEEVLICTERIKRIMDKEIAKLQQKFDNL